MLKKSRIIRHVKQEKYQLISVTSSWLPARAEVGSEEVSEEEEVADGDGIISALPDSSSVGGWLGRSEL